MGIIVQPPQVKNYTVLYYPASSTFTLPLTGINQFDCVLVSGGGGGGRSGGVDIYATGGGGFTSVTYFQNVYCTNGTLLTITVGAGGTGATVASNNGGNGNASTITGIAGNGVSTSLTSGTASGGFNNWGGGSGNFAQASTGSLNGFILTANQIYNQSRNANAFGTGMGSTALGAAPVTTSNIDGSPLFTSGVSSTASSVTIPLASGAGGTVAPLLGAYLHSPAGSTGGTGTSTGGISTANTFFAGSGGNGGGATQSIGGTGKGGGGGGGGTSGTGGTLGGVGGAGSANSGGGGGGGGNNTVTSTNSGNGGNGGSGFVIIGYWG